MTLRDRILQTSTFQSIINESDAQYKKLTEQLFDFFSSDPYGQVTLNFKHDPQIRGRRSCDYPALTQGAVENLLHYTEGLNVNRDCDKLFITFGSIPTLKPEPVHEEAGKPKKLKQTL